MVESATLAGLWWLASQTGNRELRLLLGEGSGKRWSETPPGPSRTAAARFLARPNVETRFWQPTRARYEQPSISVWYTDGPPPAALNATTQLTEACLHEHTDSIAGVHHRDLDYVSRWVQSTLDESWDARQTLRFGL